MTLILRKSSAQARIGGWDPDNRSHDNYTYTVVEETIVGRIYREMITGKPKWRWFLQRGGRFRRPSGGADRALSARKPGGLRRARIVEIPPPREAVDIEPERIFADQSGSAWRAE
jgi:hypothetical protein